MAERVYKLQPDPVDLRDKMFRSVSYKAPTQLPPSVDLRPLDTGLVFDQGQLGSCTANAIDGFKQYADKQASGTFTPLSRLYLYWHERNLEGTVGEDSGAYIRDGFKVMQAIGCCAETYFPYDVQAFTKPPTSEAESNAANHKITEYHRVADFTALQAALAEGSPVVIGMKVYASFESSKVAQTGIVPLPKRGEQALGGHAVLVVGYKKIGRTLYAIVKNSWGEGWGDKGYFYLPKSFFTKYVSDMWTGK